MQVREEDADKEVNQRPATDGGVFLLQQCHAPYKYGILSRRNRE